MQRNTTPLLVLILMAIGISLRSPGDVAGPAGSAAQSNSQAKKSESKTSGADRKGGVPKKTPGEELMDAIGSYFGSAGGSVPANARFEFLIVTVPDPAASHFSYMFDSLRESIQRAAAESGYLFDRFWLPWEKPRLEQAEKSSAEPDDQSQKRRGEPGMILFRGPDPLQPLVVFLIGESPASGLNKAAFANTLQHIRKLQGGRLPATIRLAGPTFSGSIDSLKTVIRLAREQAGREKRDLAFEIITGSATNAANSDAMRMEEVRYRSVVENDQFAGERFLDYLKKQGVLQRRVAVLSEFDTTFGQHFLNSAAPNQPGQNGSQQQDQGPLRLSFPTEISRLRNAYQDDADLRAVWSGQREKTPRQGLEFKLKDTGTPPDRIGAFSPDQTPVAQDLTMSNIAVTLRRERIEAVTIAASDILDAVFVARLIEKNCPDVRLFAIDADLLYQHSSANLSFYGMLMVATYPLFGANQVWQAPAESGVRLVSFPNQASQGLYNACRALLEPQDASKKLLEYSHPTKRDAWTPPLWLTVAGREGFWPVRLLADSEQKGSSLAPFSPPPRAYAKAFLPRPPTLWYLGFWLLTIIYFWHFGHVVYLCWPSTCPKKVFPVYIELPENRNAECLTYLLFGLVTMLGAYVPLVIVQYHYWKSAEDIGAFGLGSLATSAVVSVLIVLFMAVWSFLLHKCKGWLATLLAVALIGATLWAYWTSWQLILGPAAAGEAENLFFTFRSLFPANGVCPVLPIVLVFSGLSIWAFTHLQGLRLREVRAPGLPDLEGADPRFGGLREFAKSVEQYIGDFPLRPRGAGIAVVAILAVAGVLSQLYFDVHSLEGRPFDMVFAIAARVLYFLVVLEIVRFVCIWLALNGVLRRLAWHPIREAFNRLAAESAEVSSQAIWQRGGQRHSNAVLVVSAERLGRIAKWLPFPARQQVQDDLAEVLSWEANRTREEPEVLERLRKLLNAAADGVMQAGLARFWRGEDPEAGLAGNQEFMDRVKAAEDFVALRLAAFIRYANFQLRNRLDFISSGFLLLLISVVTYPFQQHRSLMVAVSILFLLTAAGVLFVFYQMDREAILSRLSGTDPGKLSRHFFTSALSRGAVPLGTLLVSQFPELGRLVLTVLDPILRAVH